MSRVEKERRRKIDQDNTILLNKMIKILNVSFIPLHCNCLINVLEKVKQGLRSGLDVQSLGHVLNSQQQLKLTAAEHQVGHEC